MIDGIRLVWIVGMLVGLTAGCSSEPPPPEDPPPKEKMSEEDRFFKKAVAKADPAAYTYYLNRWPHGRYAEVLRDGMREVKLFRKAIKREDPSLFTRCLDNFPDGLLAQRVRSALDQIEEYRAVRSENTATAYRRFINTYKQGDLVEEIKLYLDKRLNLDPAVAAGDPAPLRRYLRENPDGRFAAEIRGSLENVAWRRLYSQPSTKAIDDFLAEFPSGNYRKQCQDARQNAEAGQKALLAPGRSLVFLQKNPYGFWAIATRHRALGTNLETPIPFYFRIKENELPLDLRMFLSTFLHLLSLDDSMLPNLAKLNLSGYRFVDIEEEALFRKSPVRLLCSIYFQKAKRNPDLFSICYAAEIQFVEIRKSKKWHFVIACSRKQCKKQEFEVAETAAKTFCTKAPAMMEKVHADLPRYLDRYFFSFHAGNTEDGMKSGTSSHGKRKTVGNAQ